MNTLNKYLMTSANKVGMSLLIALVSWSVSAQSITESALIWDASESATNARSLDAEMTFRKVIVDLKLKEDTKKGINYRTAVCGEHEIPTVRSASLPQVTSMFPSISERNRAVGKFLKKVKADIDFLSGVPCTQLQTNLHRTIVQVTKQFDPEAEEKKLIVVSDMVEVSSIFNMYRYKNNPSGLISDFDAISQVFDRDSSLDLSGVDVVLVSPGDKDLYLWAARFWERLMKSKGAKTVTIRAAI